MVYNMSRQIIRQATPNDINEMMTIEELSFEPGIAESKDVFVSRIKTFPTGFVVIELKNHIIAYLCSELWKARGSPDKYDFTLNTPIEKKHCKNGAVFYISSMAVLPEYRGKGYATMLFEEALCIAMLKSCKKIILIVGSEWKNAIKIYKKHGFKLVLIRKNFFKPVSRKPFDGIVMARGF